eukprot:CAMPEP_0198148334 /NCGR_PEP_ID=MMETSP1443-20131203/40883_1 /TAXON_ID=186043 /ORGANISM="Entomoneis sp., Strain CCMP2396" /LENGTH=46 /DNA_ID= /DNA_START= /DNA_END= /DNA_ORIENTATION=
MYKHFTTAMDKILSYDYETPDVENPVDKEIQPMGSVPLVEDGVHLA